MLPEQDIRNRLLVARLPVLPHILIKLLEYCRAEDVGMAELAELISKDPAIATKIMGVANSSAYHRGGQKVRLEQSLLSLGTDMIRTLVISESAFQALNGFASSANINLCNFWKHSLTTAVLCRDIARRMGYPYIDEAYLAGLMHDVGRLALLAVSQKEYARLFDHDDDDALCAIELDALQLTHTDAGAFLIKRWNLDSSLCDGVLYHHESIDRIASAHPLVHIVALAHRLSMCRYDEPPVQEAAALCGLAPPDLKPMQDNAAEKVRESAEFLGIDLADATHPAGTPPRTGDSPIQKSLNQEITRLIQTSDAARTFARQQTEPKLLVTVARTACLLFKFNDALVLLLDGPKRSLVAQYSSERHHLGDFSLPLMRGGMITESVLQRRPTFVSADERHAAEETMMRALGAECLVCVPMITAGQCLGVLVGGFAHPKMPYICENVSFIQDFAAQAAAALQFVRKRNDDTRNAIASVAEEYQPNSRKVAHEVNNPLTIIKNYLNVLTEKQRRQEPIGDEIRILNDEIDRVRKILHQFAEQPPAAHAPSINLNRVVQDVVRIFRDTGFAPKSVSMTTLVEGQPTDIACDEGAIRQVLMNLFKNAVEAMPNGGAITIMNKGHINHNGRLYVGLSVSDTGPGIRQDILERLFSPVQSTKGAAHQGLGLSIVHDLIKKSNGFISCRSDAGGTLFEMLLPVRSHSEKTGHSQSS